MKRRTVERKSKKNALGLLLGSSFLGWLLRSFLRGGSFLCSRLGGLFHTDHRLQIALQFLGVLLHVRLRLFHVALHDIALHKGLHLFADLLSVGRKVLSQNASCLFGIFCAGEFIAEFGVAENVTSHGTTESTEEERKFFHRNHGEGNVCNSTTMRK